MLEKFKNIHYMFHISIVFIIFPIAGVIVGEYPLLTLLWTLLFVLAFYSVLVSQNRTVQWLAWWILLAYIFYSSVWLNGSFAWFIFYLSNLLIYQLDEISFHSWRFVSFIVLQPFILTGIYMVDQVSPWQLLFFLVTFIFSDAMTFGLYRIRLSEDIKEEKRKQNAKLNGTKPIFEILYDSTFDSGGNLTTTTDIVTLYYNPYDLIKAINLYTDQKIHFNDLILGSNSRGIDIYSRIFISIAISLTIIITSIFINIFIGFSLGALFALNSYK